MRPHRARSQDHASKGDTIVGLGPPNQDEEVDKAPSNHRRKPLCHKTQFSWGTVTFLTSAGRAVK